MKNTQIPNPARQVLRTFYVALTLAWPLVPLTLALPLVALAQTGVDQRAITKACAGDVLLHCTGVKPGGGRIVACLQEHQATLSDSCKAQLPLVSTCQQAVQKLCGEADPAALRICASEKKGQLPVGCRALVA